MDPIRESVRELSDQIKERANDLHRVDKETLLRFLDTIGRRQKLTKATPDVLEAVRRTGGLFAVDASYQRFGGASPHYLELYQGLGVSTLDMKHPIRKTAAHSPLLTDSPASDFSFSEQRSKEAETRLAALELETAMELVGTRNGYALVMDGSLIRFQILCPAEWEQLQALCATKKLPVVGVIEDIKTDSIGQSLKAGQLTRYTHYDREILAGHLQKGEVFLPKKEVSGKAERGLSTLFARFSTEPHVIGIDFDGEDEQTLLQLASVLYAITPSHGRGVPYLLDVVDEKARLQDRRTLEMMKRTLDSDVLEAYFVSGREQRRI